LAYATALEPVQLKVRIFLWALLIKKENKMVFKKLQSGEEIQLVTYIKEYMETYSDAEILIGCDSQNSGTKTIYAIVAVLYVEDIDNPAPLMNTLLYLNLSQPFIIIKLKFKELIHCYIISRIVFYTNIISNMIVSFSSFKFTTIH